VNCDKSAINPLLFSILFVDAFSKTNLTQHKPKNIMSQTPPQVIPNPPDFPVHWDNPNDAQLFWNFAPVFPKVITPLGFDLICKPLIEGENRTHIYYQLPVILLVRRINGYYYFALQKESLPKSEEDTLQAAIDNLGKLWENEWLPDIKQHLHYFENYDLAHADLPALSQHLDEMVTRTHSSD
jgi:hypothetical protein